MDLRAVQVCTTQSWKEMRGQSSEKSGKQVRHELKVESSTDISCTGACNIAS